MNLFFEEDIPGGDHRISNIGAVMPRIMDFILNEG